MEKGGGGGGAAPTGCYKCGRPGHWSRDCPSNPTSNSKTHETNKDLNNDPSGSAYYPKKRLNSFMNNASKSNSASEKPKRLPRTRPKLTPDLLLSNDGLGHILRHFPRAFKYRGRGHEVEQIGAKNRVKRCIRELRERVANGADPTKLHESQFQGDMPIHEQDVVEEQKPFHENASVKNPIDKNTFVQNLDTDNHQGNILNEIWENAMEEPSQPSTNKIVQADASPGGKETTSKSRENTSSSSNAVLISEEQRARMQANRLKALEKAAARARSMQ